MTKSRIYFAAIAGLATLALYLATSTGALHNVTPLVRALAFLIGPIAIVGVLRISGHLANQGPMAEVQPATVFLVIAFSLLTLMIVVQQAVLLRFHDLSRAAAEAATVETLRTSFSLVNEVQLGIDASFDLFYCSGIALLSLAMYRSIDFGRAIGAFGVASGAGLLVLNLIAFPNTPSQAGLPDLGPLTAVWWVLVIVQFVRAQRRLRAASGDDA